MTNSQLFSELESEIENKLPELLVSFGTRTGWDTPFRILVTNLADDTFTFLQNLNALKQLLYAHGFTFKPYYRIDENNVLLEVVERHDK